MVRPGSFLWFLAFLGCTASALFACYLVLWLAVSPWLLMADFVSVMLGYRSSERKERYRARE